LVNDKISTIPQLIEIAKNRVRRELQFKAAKKETQGYSLIGGAVSEIA
jgi:hypothetical protein